MSSTSPTLDGGSILAMAGRSSFSVRRSGEGGGSATCSQFRASLTSDRIRKAGSMRTAASTSESGMGRCPTDDRTNRRFAIRAAIGSITTGGSGFFDWLIVCLGLHCGSTNFETDVNQGNNDRRSGNDFRNRYPSTKSAFSHDSSSGETPPQTIIRNSRSQNPVCVR